MSSTFSGVNIALSALRAQQIAIDATGHNIANANTQGYSRKVVTMVPMESGYMDASGAFPGRGVKIQDIARIRDAFLDMQTRNELKTLGEYEAVSRALDEIERIMAEPSDSGIRTVLANFWDALQDVAAYPEDHAIRNAMVQNGWALAEGFNHTHRQLVQLQEDTSKALESKVQEVNLITKEIINLNDLIVRAKARGEDAGDLLDGRDLLLDKLSGIIQVEIMEQPNGAVRVLISNGPSLVEQYSKLELHLDRTSGGFPSITLGEGGPVFEAGGGEIQGLLGVRDEIIPGLKAELDALASSMITEMNKLQAEGFTLVEEGQSSEHGPEFFLGSGASDIRVNILIEEDPRKIAASLTGLAGDGENALRMAQLKHARIMKGATATWDDHLRGVIGDLAIQAREARRIVGNETLLLKDLENRKASVSGVSLDEEAANLVKYQHAYNAAARVITTIDEMLDILIKGTGLVGR